MKGGKAVTTALMSGILIIGVTLTSGSVILILLDQHETSLREFAVLGLFCSMLMMLSYYVELNTPGIAAKIDALKFGYIGRVFVNPVLLMLAVRYYEAKVGKLWQAMLFIIPIITLFLVFTCEQHELYYKQLSLMKNGLLHVVPGVFYYIYMAYNTVLAMLFLSLCLYERASLRGRARTNNTILMLSCLIPFFSLMVYLSGWTHAYDVTSVGVMIAAMLITFSVLRYGLLNKEEMLQNMATGLIFLDSDFRLIYANRKAAQIIPAIGTKLLRAQFMDLAQLCEDEYATIQSGGKSYQRKITEWTNSEGQHGRLLTFDDITEIRARLNRDAMTGLLNHATFYPMLDESIAESGQIGKPLTVSIADIDSFKKVNDTYGHANGDIILIALAGILEEYCGIYGEVFRYGGEEFAVIFHCDQALAEKSMRKALEAFSGTEFPFIPYSVTFSYGSAQFDGAETSVALFDRADQIMYTRKKALHARERAAEQQAAEAAQITADAS